MTRQELDSILNKLGLNVPEVERNDLAAAAKFVEEIKVLVRKHSGQQKQNNQKNGV